MIKKSLLVVILLFATPVSEGNYCCQAYHVFDQYGRATGLFYIHNNWNRWVSCRAGEFVFQIPPLSNSRTYPARPWYCG